MDISKYKLNLKCDMNLDGDFSNGYMYVENGHLKMESDADKIYALDLKDVKEVKLNTNIGCGYIECKYKSEDFLLARCTTKRLKIAGEFVKAINYYIETGEETQVDDGKDMECPICGRPYLEGSTTCMHCVKKSTIIIRTLKLMKPFMKKFMSACILLTISNMLYVLTPMLNQILIDDYLRLKTGTVGSILTICGAMLLVRAMGEFLFIFSSRFINQAGSYFANSLRHLAYEKVQSLSMSSMARKTTGDLLKRITQDTQKVREFLIDQGRWLFEMAVQLLAVGVIICTTEPMLAMMILLPAPLALWLSTTIWNKIMLKYDKQWRLFSRSNSILHDIIRGIRVVKAFGNEKREIKKFSNSCKDLAQISMENERLYAVIFPIISFLVGLGEFFVLYFGGKMVLGRELSIGELVKFTMYISFIYGPLRWMTSLPRWLADVMTSLLKIFEILDEEPEIIDIKDSVSPKIKGTIEFRNVTFGYKSYEPVLKNVSFVIKPGEMIGLVGPSGTGKSTLINLIMRLYDVNSGSILIDGIDIRSISMETLHESLGIVFQENFLFAGSIFENLAYASPQASIYEIIAASKVANAHEFIMKLPDAYNTSVGENGYTLSGGERQRIAIARAILRNPAILILDEATASLDVETESKIQEALTRLVKGRTTIAIAHRLSTLKDANRLLVLDKGELAEFGTHAELLASKGIYYKLVMAQLQTQAVKKSNT